MGGQIFKTEKRQPEEQDMHALLPAFWRGMLPEEKKGVFRTIHESDEDFNVQCCRRLYSEHAIPFKQLQQVRMCYDMAIKYPDHLDKGAISDAEVELAEQLPEEVKTALQSTRNINEGLESFNLKPSGMEGIDLFDHMINFRRQNAAIEHQKPSEYLVVEVNKEKKQDQILTLMLFFKSI